MKEIVQKKICFEKSFYYFQKDKEVYNSCDCHTNTYIRFFDQNYEEVEMRENDFKYVTGLMVYDNGENKYCVVHSWIEDKGMIIDTTSLANSQLKSLSAYPKDYVKEIEDLLDKKIRYIPYFSLTNKQFTLKCQELYCQCGFNQIELLKTIEDYLISIAQSVEEDEDFLSKATNSLGCEYKKDGFYIEID